MIVSIIIGFLLMLLVIFLILPAHFKIKIAQSEVSIKLIFINVIKIKLKEKTKNEKIKKDKIIFSELNFNEKKKLLKSIFPSFKYLAAKAKVEVDLKGTIGLSTADKTAIVVGIINMIIYNFEGLFHNIFKKYNGNYKISPNFTKEILEYGLSFEVSTFSFYIIIFLIKFIKEFKSFKKYKKII